MDLDTLHAIARDALEKRSSHAWKEPGNKFYHGERTAKLALHLREILFPGETQGNDILTVAAWFHDLRNGEENHCELGAEETARLIAPYCTPAECGEICRIIRRHDDRTSPRTDFSDLEKLHQDADLLDHFGTYDIWMSFLYSAHHGETPLSAAEFMRREKLQDYDHWLNRLNYELSRCIYREKLAYQLAFLDRFDAELDGQIWTPDRVLETCHGEGGQAAAADRT